jgi:Flp pilus assembly pilin Flp
MRKEVKVRSNERGATTVEWLGLATIAVIVVAMLIPQVRSAAADVWSSIVAEMTGFFS